MPTYRVEDMVCGHCVNAITRAVYAVDPSAEVAVNLGKHLVHIERTQADPAAFTEAIAAAGYGAVPMEQQQDASAGARTVGCCCGGGASTCGT
jgi:copper chaperone